jgi:hypothetical protein
MWIETQNGTLLNTDLTRGFYYERRFRLFEVIADIGVEDWYWIGKFETKDEARECMMQLHDMVTVGHVAIDVTMWDTRRRWIGPAAPEVTKP